MFKILSTSADVPYSKDGRFDSTCAKCALRKISSTLLLEGVTVEQISSRLCGRFPQNFKYVLAAEIRKFQKLGLKYIDIANISTDKKKNLIIDFDIIVDPKYNEAIRSALRRAVVSVDVRFFYIEMSPFYINTCLFFLLASTCIQIPRTLLSNELRIFFFLHLNFSSNSCLH